MSQLLFIFFLFSSSLSKSQNLIDNPGFKDGMDHWWGFGSTKGTGSGTIGKQSYVDLNASMLPFSIPGIVSAYDWFAGTPVTLTDAGGGWKKLQKTVYFIK